MTRVHFYPTVQVDQQQHHVIAPAATWTDPAFVPRVGEAVWVSSRPCQVSRICFVDAETIDVYVIDGGAA